MSSVSALPAISFKNVTKVYPGNVEALKDISFDVQEGEFFGFLGPNGAGKTTSINIMTGLANFNSGSACVFGQDVITNYRETRRMIGLSPQEFNFDPYFSIEKLLRYEAGYFGVSFRRAKERAHHLLNEFGLFEKRSQTVRRLSGGMKRRLLIARALMHDPKILILDEPTAGVDLELRYRLWQFLKELNEAGRTIFLTTHYLEEAEKLCSRIGVVHEGKIVAIDEKERLIRDISGHWVYVDLKDALSALPEELAQLGLELKSPTQLCFRQEETDMSEVINEVIRLGYRIDHVEQRKSSLEDTFVKLTGMKNAMEKLSMEGGLR